MGYPIFVFANMDPTYICKQVVTSQVCTKVHVNKSYLNSMSKVRAAIRKDLLIIQKLPLSETVKARLATIKITIDWNTSQTAAWYHI
jgi:hypothetical protein